MPSIRDCSKRARSEERDTEDGLRRSKRIRAIIAQRISELEDEERAAEDSAFVAAGGTIKITVPKTYKEAVNDAQHGDK